MILVVLVAVGQRLGYARAYIGNTTTQNLGAPRFADARKKAGGAGWWWWWWYVGGGDTSRPTRGQQSCLLLQVLDYLIFHLVR